jgi:alkylation response protein AidB-like acyl-CoA dehydrogenase
MSASALIDPRNLNFMLKQVYPIAALCTYPQFAHHSEADFDAIISLAHELALKKFLPHNRAADLHEPELHEGKVKIIVEVKQALDAYAQAGFPAAVAELDDGGMALPFSVSLVCDALFASANVSTTGYAMLARGVANLLKAHGSDDQQKKYMQPILQGRFLGTMCLSEPQAGSSLGDIKTMAHVQADGSYRISGAKMWISGGEHEMSENIIHLVLAKMPGGPPGVKGISLFIVPKFLVNDDGSVGAKNDVQCAGVNHKLGQRGIVNTFLKFGEHDQCIAYLVGKPHQGLAQMFHMMNEARIGVAVGAVMLGTAGYLYSLEYAKQRIQGRHPEQKDPTSPPVPIIEHADVKRMLLQQKTYTEGAFALAIFAANLIDQRNHAVQSEKANEANMLLELLTPILKAWSGQWCCKANDLAIQVLGGYGYTREYPVEQYYRDNRLNPIHEGANGIQAIDLLGRKVMLGNGRAFELFQQHVYRCIEQAVQMPPLKKMADDLAENMAQITRCTQNLTAAMHKGQLRLALANVSDYLNAMGHVSIAWMWLNQAIHAQQCISNASTHELDFYEGKLQAARFFFAYELPSTQPWIALLNRLDDTCLQMPEAGF